MNDPEQDPRMIMFRLLIAPAELYIRVVAWMCGCTFKGFEGRLF